MSAQERKLVIMPGYLRFLVRFKGYIEDEQELEAIAKAYLWAKEGHRGQYRGDGVTHYFKHLRDVADIITVELGLKHDWRLVAAAWLHDIVEDNEAIDHAEVNKRFGSVVAYWVDLCTKGEVYKVNKGSYIIRFRETRCIEALIIKLADRLANLRTLGMVPDEKFQIKQASETIRDYLPLADLLIDWMSDSQIWSSKIYVGIHLKAALEAQIRSLHAEYGDVIYP